MSSIERRVKEAVREELNSNTDKARGHPDELEVHQRFDEAFGFQLKDVTPIDPQDPVEGVEVTMAITMYGRDVGEMIYAADEIGAPEWVTRLNKV